LPACGAGASVGLTAAAAGLAAGEAAGDAAGEAAGFAAGDAAGEGDAATAGDAAGAVVGLGAAVGGAAGGLVGDGAAAGWQALSAKTAASRTPCSAVRLTNGSFGDRDVAQEQSISADTRATMDAPATPAEHAILAPVELAWDSGQRTSALLLHSARTMLVLEASDPRHVLPPLGTIATIDGAGDERTGRLAEHGRAGRFLIALGEREVRCALRLRVSLPGNLRCRTLDEPREVEIADLTTGGARIRGIELPVGTQVTLDFVPPGSEQSVSVRATVAHGTHGATRPWIGVAFRLVAIRGGR